MMNILEIPVIELTQEEVQPYGRTTSPQSKHPPDVQGAHWKCWYPLGKLQPNYSHIIGMVIAEPCDKVFHQMEKHPNRSEWVFALDKPYIQAVALSDVQAINSPDLITVKAFLVRPGQGILISKDVWHAPGIAAFDEPSLYGFVLGEPKKVDEGTELGLVPFENDEAVRCVMKRNQL